MNIAVYHRDANQNHAMSEKFFTLAAEKLVEVLRVDRFDEVAQQMLESVNESLQSGVM
jgi:c-di-AMP phosphodiesterase-like protein